MLLGPLLRLVKSEAVKRPSAWRCDFTPSQGVVQRSERHKVREERHVTCQNMALTWLFTGVCRRAAVRWSCDQVVM